MLIGMSLLSTAYGSDVYGKMEFMEGRDQNPDGDDTGELLLFIHSADLMCFNCLEGILEFIRMLPRDIQHARVRGILVPRRSDRDRYSAASPLIQLKKIRGFIAAHQLCFRVVVDSRGIFSSFVSEGSLLVVVDASRGACTGYDFPLSRKEKQEIRSALGLSLGLCGRSVK